MPSLALTIGRERGPVLLGQPLELTIPVRLDATEDFDNLLHTHPALFMVQYSLAQTLLRRGMKPDVVLGYSLGEWVALAVSGALPPALTAATQELILRLKLR